MFFHKPNLERLYQTMINLESLLTESFNRYPKYTRVIILGKDGVSKSAISNALIGIPLQIVENEFGDPILISEDAPFKMNNEKEIPIPTIYADDENKLLICELYGFLEHNVNQYTIDVFSSYAINKFMESESKTRILFVLAVNQIESVLRCGHNIDNTITLLSKIFSTEELEQRLGVVISRGDGSSVEEYFKELEFSTPNLTFHNFGKFCLENIADRVFSFPNAKKDDIGQQYKFEDREKLLCFLKSTHVEKLNHHISLEAEQLLQLCKIIDSFYTIGLPKLFLEIEHLYITENSKINDFIEYREIYFKVMEKLKNIETTTELANIIEENIRHPELIQQRLAEIKSFQNLLLFTSKIDDESLNMEMVKPIQIQSRIENILQNEIAKITNLIKSQEIDK